MSETKPLFGNYLYIACLYNCQVESEAQFSSASINLHIFNELLYHMNIVSNQSTHFGMAFVRAMHACAYLVILAE